MGLPSQLGRRWEMRMLAAIFIHAWRMAENLRFVFAQVGYLAAHRQCSVSIKRPCPIQEENLLKLEIVSATSMAGTGS